MRGSCAPSPYPGNVHACRLRPADAPPADPGDSCATSLLRPLSRDPQAQEGRPSRCGEMRRLEEVTRGPGWDQSGARTKHTHARHHQRTRNTYAQALEPTHARETRKRPTNISIFRLSWCIRRSLILRGRTRSDKWATGSLLSFLAVLEQATAEEDYALWLRCGPRKT